MSTALFPTLAGLAFPVVRTPLFRTSTQESVSGKETRAALWTYPRWKWTLGINFLRDDSNDEFRTLLGFWLARQGAFDSFLFDDPDDNLVIDQPLGVGNGTALSFPLVRTLGSYDEPVNAVNITVPALSMTNVKVNGAVKSFGSEWTWNFGTWGPYGVQFTTGHAPAGGQSVTISMKYYWPVRFLADDNDFSKFMNKLWEARKIEFISVKN